MNKRLDGGFSLVEIVIATAVIGVITLSLTNLYIATSVIQRQSDRLELATRTAENKIESLRNNHYNNLPLSPPDIDFTADLPAELDSPRSATVTVTEPQPGIKRLDVNIIYNEYGNARSVKLSTLIGNLGISQ